MGENLEIKRTKTLNILKKRLKSAPAVAILGPRQCGKTTLSHQFAQMHPNNVYFFDLENPLDLAKLENPLLTLEGLEGFIIIDEIQRKPDLFPVLRVLIDKKIKAKFILLGSASLDLLKQSSETLAGRISYIELEGFSLDILNSQADKKLWIRGGFPRSYLAKNEEASFQWRLDFIRTFLERDIPNLGITIPTASLRQFWLMLSHYHGQIFNSSEIGQSMGIADTTAKRYLDILCATFLIREIRPWFYNTKKRLVKRPKIYFKDSGIFHALLSIKNNKDLINHPKLGASWEGFALEQTIQYLNLAEQEVFFWNVHTGADLDLVFMKHGKLWGVEVKYTDAPKITQSMKSALSELSLAHLWVVYPGEQNYKLAKNVSVISIKNFSNKNSSFKKIS